MIDHLHQGDNISQRLDLLTRLLVFNVLTGTAVFVAGMSVIFGLSVALYKVEILPSDVLAEVQALSRKVSEMNIVDRDDMINAIAVHSRHPHPEAAHIDHTHE